MNPNIQWPLRLKVPLSVNVEFRKVQAAQSWLLPCRDRGWGRLEFKSGSVIQGRSESPVSARVAGRMTSKRPLLSPAGIRD